MNFQIILSLLIIFAIIRLFFQLLKKHINLVEFLFFISAWLIVFFFNWNNDILNKIGKLFGVEKGASVLVYISLFFLFYYVFVSIVKFYRIEREINKLVRKDAVGDFLRRYGKENK